jgi:hypothetical protein
VPPNDADGIDPAFVFRTLLAKLAVVANDADVAVVAFPRNDPLKVPTDPELTTTNPSKTMSDSEVGAWVKLIVLPVTV